MWNQTSIRNRIGRFYLSDAVFDANCISPEALFKLFGQMIVLHAEHFGLPRRCYEYVALSPLFDEIGENQEPPLYQILTHRDDNGTISVKEAQKCEFQSEPEKPVRSISFREFL